MDREITVELRGATRKNNSVDGCPSFEILTDSGSYRTQTNAAVNYDVDNHTGRPGHSTESWVGRKVVLTVTPGRRVTYWRLAP